MPHSIDILRGLLSRGGMITPDDLADTSMQMDASTDLNSTMNRMADHVQGVGARDALTQRMKTINPYMPSFLRPASSQDVAQSRQFQRDRQTAGLSDDEFAEHFRGIGEYERPSVVPIFHRLRSRG